VWDLYQHACRHFGATATLLERDDHIPPMPELIAELNLARQLQQQALMANAAEIKSSLQRGLEQ
jgi:hypothetical protein